MEEEKKNQFKYFDNEYIRSISSNDFNFALDKESKVSICWGRDQNENPLFDPISPQEIIFQINSNTTIYHLINSLNTIAVIKKQKKLNEEYQKINPISNQNEFKDLLNSINLKIFSTVTFVTLNIIDQLDNTICSNFIKYLNKFNINTQIQINKPITSEDITKLKFLSPDIILLYNEETIETYKNLIKESFNVNVKIRVNNDNFRTIIDILKELDKNVKGKIYLNYPFIDNVHLIELQGRINNLKLHGIYLNACNLDKFNKDDKIFKHTIEISNCDSCTFSCYVNNQYISPCERNFLTKISSIDNNYWYSQKMKQFREKIIQKSFC